MKYTTNNLEEFGKIATGFIETVVPSNSGATVVGLYGDLGAGKTTFVQSVAKSLGIEDVVTSPTFVIEKIYELTNHPSTKSGQENFTHLIHIDAYRLESENELLQLGWQNIISNPKNLIMIEWPEKVANIMPKHTKIILKPLQNEDSREVEVLL